MLLFRHTILVGVLALMGAPGGARRAPSVAELLAGPSMSAPAHAPARQDSAETVYATARDAFGRGDFRRAATLFEQVATRYPKSDRRLDALYWRAFSLYRAGSTTELRQARSSLATLRAADSTSYRRDGASLDTRICGELARRGDERCAATVERRADSVSFGDAIGDVVRAATSIAGTATKAALDAAASVMRDPELQMTIAEAGATARDAARDASRASSDAMRGLSRDMERAARDMDRTSGSSARGRSRSSSDCEDDEDDERVIALNALLQMDADRALPMLKKVMARRDKCAEVLRRKAVFLIAQKRSPESADLLIDAARNDPDAEVREQAVFWLSRVSDQRAVGFLRDLATKSGGDVEMRKKAVFSLSQMQGGSATLRDVARASDADPEVRGEAIFWLGQRGTAEDMDFLRTLYPQLTNHELKDKVLFAASRHKNTGDWLLTVAQDPKETTELRKQALFWAGRGGVAQEQLVSLYDKVTDADMKEQLIFVFSQRGSGPSFEKLLDIGRNEKNKDLRSKAVFWLSRSKDPRALKLLEDIINK